MSFIRPEARAFFRKWREAIIAGVILMGSLQAASATTGVVNALSWATALLGAALFIEGVRRARLPQDGGGLGMVEIDERQITYLAPNDRGGVISFDDLAEIKIRTTQTDTNSDNLHWRFKTHDGQLLTIPGNAENMFDIYDNLPALPGINWDAVMQANHSTETADFLVWKRP